MITEMNKERKRRSELMSKAEMILLKRFVNEQPTNIDAAEMIGVTVHTLTRVQAMGSCSPATAEKIRAVIK